MLHIGKLYKYGPTLSTRILGDFFGEIHRYMPDPLAKNVYLNKWFVAVFFFVYVFCYD